MGRVEGHVRVGCFLSLGFRSDGAGALNELTGDGRVRSINETPSLVVSGKWLGGRAGLLLVCRVVTGIYG